jgi:adenylosuccinate synthase
MGDSSDLPTPRPLDHPLPAGMRDLLPDEAASRRRLSRQLLESFALYGYVVVTPPVFEFAEVLERGLGTLAPADVLRFIEPESGEVAALRPDMTPQIARIVATRLRDRPPPFRLCYEGTVLRRRSGRARKHRQIPQVGVELAGVSAPDGDLELLALAADALRAAGLRQFTIDLGNAMTAVVVVGAQWGDEGKGKIVDIFTEHADMVVRYGGGPNAGHTLVVGNDKLVVRLIPSGILREKTTCVLAQGMVIDPGSLVGELDELARRGLVRAKDSLVVSDRAHAILPYHVLVDGLREQTVDALGTTKRGVGPCYEDKVGRRGVPLGALRDLKRAEASSCGPSSPLGAHRVALGGKVPTVARGDGRAPPAGRASCRLLAETSKLVERAVRDGKRVLFEGAQGTLLDIDHGTYPFVTSSHATAGGACTGVGVGPSRIDSVVGLVKAYCTRVGGGPFPTELRRRRRAALRKRGDEFGSVTGRPRRTGWLDLPALRYAVRVNGLDGLALTKLDVLTGLDPCEIRSLRRTSRLREQLANFGEHVAVLGRGVGADWDGNLVERAAARMLEPARARRQRVGAGKVARASAVLRSRRERFIEAFRDWSDGWGCSRGRAQSRDLVAWARGGTCARRSGSRGARSSPRCCCRFSRRRYQGPARARRPVGAVGLGSRACANGSSGRGLQRV